MGLRSRILQVISIGVAMLASTQAHAAGSACKPLRDIEHGWSVRIDSAGRYCMAADLFQSAPPRALLLPHQPVPQSPMMGIAASDVTVDLDGHTLRATQATGQGVWINVGAGNLIRSVELRNGSIRTDKRPAVFMVHAFNRRNLRFRRNSTAAAIAIADNMSDYQHTGFVLENLTIEASDVALILQGRDNVIRHCKIVGGNGTVNLYGPGLVFEDNELVLNAAETKADGEAPVALYLEDAADSVVRNNRITVRGSDVGGEAIVLKNSPNVMMQNNSVMGARQDYRLLDEKSSVSVQ